MKCTRCNCEMTKSEKCRLVDAMTYYNRITSTSLFNRNVCLYAEKDAKGFKSCIGEGRKEEFIVPEIFVCETCGHIEYVLTKEQIQKFKQIESDNEFHNYRNYLRGDK